MADRKIDVHAHFVPPFWRTALLENGYDHPDGTSGIPDWTIESHLEYMNATGTAKSILSISSPGTDLTSDIEFTKSLTRQTNEYAADIKRQDPTHFGFFASLPLPDIVAAVDEIEYALDTLNADGFVLHSNTAGIYLGDPNLRPVLRALDDRNAVVFVHPTTPSSSHSCHEHDSPAERYAASSPLAEYYTAPLFEFWFDSTRSFIDLLASGTVLRFPRIRWIISHCGNTLPSLLDRLFFYNRLGAHLAEGRDSLPISEEQSREAVRQQFWFDLAGDPIPNLVDAVLKFTGKDRLMWGTDVPYTPFDVAQLEAERAESGLPAAVGDEWLDSVYWESAERLLPEQENGLGRYRRVSSNSSKL